MFNIKPMTSSLTLDCGPTCLKMLLDYYGIEVNQDELNQACKVDLIGCTAKDIKETGNRYGLNLKAYEMGTDELIKQDRPAIIWWKYNHFCIYCGLNDENKIVIINPDRGRFSMSKSAFDTYYSNVAIFNGEPQDLPKELTVEEKFDALMEYLGLTGNFENGNFKIEKK